MAENIVCYRSNAKLYPTSDLQKDFVNTVCAGSLKKRSCQQCIYFRHNCLHACRINTCVFSYIIKQRIHMIFCNIWHRYSDIRAVLHFLCACQRCVSVPGLLSGGSWQTSPAKCCARPMLQQTPSTPVPAGLRSAGSAVRHSGPTPGAGSQLT